MFKIEINVTTIDIINVAGKLYYRIKKSITAFKKIINMSDCILSKGKTIQKTMKLHC